jgi:hypothetical protein
MYPHGLLLSLAVRASPQTHDGATPSMPFTPTLGFPGLRNVQVHVALAGGTVPTPAAPQAPPQFAPVEAPTSALPTPEVQEAPVAPPAPVDKCAPDTPTVVTAIALTPQLEEFVNDRISAELVEAIEHYGDEALNDMVDEKISEALTEHTDTLERLEARIDELEERESSGVHANSFEELRLDVDDLSEELGELKALRATVAALTATCEAFTARVAQLEHAAGGARHHGVTDNEGEG